MLVTDNTEDVSIYSISPSIYSTVSYLFARSIFHTQLGLPVPGTVPAWHVIGAQYILMNEFSQILSCTDYARHCTRFQECKDERHNQEFNRKKVSPNLPQKLEKCLWRSPRGNTISGINLFSYIYNFLSYKSNSYSLWKSQKKKEKSSIILSTTGTRCEHFGVYFSRFFSVFDRCVYMFYFYQM